MSITESFSYLEVLLNHMYVFRKKELGYSTHGLAHWSESPFESSHKAFKEHWKRVAVGLNHKEHAQKLLNCVLDINAGNI